MNTLRLSLFGLLISLLFLYALLPADAYHGVNTVMGIFIITCSIFFGFGKLTLLLLSLEQHKGNNLSPLISISLILGSISSGLIFNINLKGHSPLLKQELYIPKYEIAVNTNNCKNNSTRRGLFSRNCSINIQSINSDIGSLIIDDTFKAAELHCIKFDIEIGKLGLPYAHNLITCDKFRNKQRVQAYRKSVK